MNPAKKVTIVLTAVFFMVILLLGMASQLSDEIVLLDEPLTETGVGSQLWDFRTLDMLTLAVMMFAGVLGVIALVGGEFKWS